jgi:hypothetical protein
MLISESGGISTLPGCAQKTWLFLQQPVTIFMFSQYNHIKYFPQFSLLETHRLVIPYDFGE